MFGYEKVKGLLIAKVGTENADCSKIENTHFIICRFKRTFYDVDSHVYDIFNGARYYLKSYNTDSHKCIRYFPLIEVIDDYDKIKYGYLSRRYLFELMHYLNDESLNFETKKYNTKKLTNNVIKFEK